MYFSDILAFSLEKCEMISIQHCDWSESDRTESNLKMILHDCSLARHFTQKTDQLMWKSFGRPDFCNFLIMGPGVVIISWRRSACTVT